MVFSLWQSNQKKNAHLFFRSEIIYDVEKFSDLLGGFAFDHIGDRLAPDITAHPTSQHSKEKKKKIRRKEFCLLTGAL
jgi:hypothetical protein